MPNALLNVLTFTLIPVAAAVLGGVFAVWKPPGLKIRSFVQHFAAGVVMAAAAGELLPDVVHEKSVWAVVVGGGLGIGVMLAVKELAKRAKGNLHLLCLLTPFVIEF